MTRDTRSIFRFGIHTLDSLFHGDSPSTRLVPLVSTSCAIMGPDGCGKSLLAMHLASTYLADSRHIVRRTSDLTLPVAIYASTDLSWEQAKASWTDFALEFPDLRERAIDSSYRGFVPWKGYSKADLKEAETAIPIQRFTPVPLPGSLPDSAASETQLGLSLQELLSEPSTLRLCLLDLQRESSGDDWTFLNRLV
jgi:hypothetical protein